ncbi:MAG TPA: alpha/beta hydrolase [Steroidobacteraceae bacterium]|jgi:acetyl esterase/lipase|nr:alpha/beta hydrolase [Steroidobacteraceae bacterium]
MKTQHLVDPQLLPLLELFPTMQFSVELLPEIRARAFPAPADPRAAAVAMETQMVSGPAGAPDVPIFIYRPREKSGPLPCIFHIHGGGYVVGSAATMEPFHRPLALDADCCIVSVDYRLAPETRYPGAIEDCYAALAWVHKQAAAIGVDARRIGVMGESAGGGLAAALALLARDRREYKLAFQHLIYPMLDDRTCVSASPHPFTGEFIWTPHNNKFGWSSLLGVPPGSDGVSPYAAPARAADLARLPPTFISTGALDLFLEEDIDYAQRLARHGVPVELHVYPGAYHAFDLEPNAQIAVNARRDSVAALRRFMHEPG